MRVVNWLDFENLRDAYIMDGVPKWKANILAKRDCRNNPYEKRMKKILDDELKDAARMEGQTYFNFGQILSDGMDGVKKALRNFVNGPIGYILAVLAVIIFVYGGATLIDGALVYFIWNVLVASAFSVDLLTFPQAMVVGFIFIILSSMFKKSKS